MTTLTDTQVVTASGGLVELANVLSAGNTNVTQTTVGTAPTLATATFVADGGPVLVEFDVGVVSPPVVNAGLIHFALFIDGVSVRNSWSSVRNANSSANFLDTPVALRHRFEPSAGSHTVAVKTYVSSGTGTVHSGGPYGDARLRVSKIVQATQWPAVTTGTIICTSTTRPASPFEGQTIYETDTDYEFTYTGSAWMQTGGTGAWQLFTPVITQSVSVAYSGPLRYTRIGRTVHANCALSISGAGTGGNIVTVSLPIAANASLPVVGAAWIYDASAGTRYICTADLQSTTSVAFQHDTSGASAWGAAPNIALAASDQIRFGITYEAAS